jgi:hypothetical protein
MGSSITSRPPEMTAPNGAGRGRDQVAIWDGDGQSFNVGPLRQAMLVRGFTPEALADAAGVARGTLYNALHGRPTRLRTAHRILAALAEAQPILRLGLASRDE